MSNQDFNPDTHIRGDDGQIYERKIVAATGIAVGFHNQQPKTAIAAALERAMQDALYKADAEGITNPKRLKAIIQKAHDRTLNEAYEDPA